MRFFLFSTPLQAAAREDNTRIDELRAEEKAERQAQQKKETAEKQANIPFPTKKNPLVKATKALGSKQKVVRFNGSDESKEVVP